MDEKRELEASSLIVDEESNEHADTMPLDHHNQKKMFLGSKPADLRYSEPFKGLQYPENNPY